MTSLPATEGLIIQLRINRQLKKDAIESISKAMRLNPRMGWESKESLLTAINQINSLSFYESPTKTYWHNMSHQDSALSWINIAIDKGVSKSARPELLSAISFLNALRLD